MYLVLLILEYSILVLARIFDIKYLYSMAVYAKIVAKCKNLVAVEETAAKVRLLAVMLIVTK